MNCCNAYGNCTQGRNCPVRTGVVTHAQACHAARTAPHHPRVAQPGDVLPVQFVGPEPVEPTAPLDDCMPLTPRESRQVAMLVACWLAVACGMVLAGIWYVVAVVMALAVAMVFVSLIRVWERPLP